MKNIGIFVKDEEEEEEEGSGKENERKPEILGRGKRTAVIESKLRTEHSSEEKRKQHQKELAQQLNELAKARLAQQSGGKEQEKIRKSTVSYKSLSHMPREPEVKELKLYVGNWNLRLFVKLYMYDQYSIRVIYFYSQTRSMRL